MDLWQLDFSIHLSVVIVCFALLAFKIISTIFSNHYLVYSLETVCCSLSCCAFSTDSDVLSENGMIGHDLSSKAHTLLIRIAVTMCWFLQFPGSRILKTQNKNFHKKAGKCPFRVSWGNLSNIWYVIVTVTNFGSKTGRRFQCHSCFT